MSTSSILSGVGTGAATGASIGSIIPGMGTAVGGILGGIVGGVSGYISDDEDPSDEIKKLRLNPPNMDIPSSMMESISLYRMAADRNQVPGYDLYKQRILENTAQGIAASREAATSPSDLLGATTSLYGQQSQALTQLEIEGARQQAANRQMYAQSLQNLGQWQQQQFYMNEYYPYVSRMNELQAIQQSEYDRLVGGINTIASTIAGLGGQPKDRTVNNNMPQNVYLTQQAPYNQGQGIDTSYLNTQQPPQGGSQIDLSGYNNVTNIWG